MLGLVDTGAGISMTRSELAELLGIFHIDKSPFTIAAGMVGIPVRMIGSANLELDRKYVCFVTRNDHTNAFLSDN